MNILKKYWKIILGIIIIGFFIFKIAQTFAPKDEIVKIENNTVVEIFSLDQVKTGKLETLCSVEATTDADILSEASGKIVSVLVKEGQSVKRNQVILSLENTQQRLSVQNARVALSSANLALSELLNKNTSKEGSLLGQTKTQQEIAVASAKNTYYNNNLQAYPEDYDETSVAPTISGNYNCDDEGEYIIDVYSSAANSGSSISLSGLENGRASVSTDYPVALGSCGLEIVFPKDFKGNRTWIIPVPNTRSSSYFSTKKAYENAQSGKDIVLNQTTASPERIAQERARVTQAQLALEVAQNELNKSSVKAPVDGIITNFDSAVGDYVNLNAVLGTIKTVDSLKLVAYVNADEKKYLSEGSLAFVDGNEFTIESISPSVDSTKKIKVTLSDFDDVNFTEGTERSCSLNRNSQEKISEEMIIPLSAISIIGTEPFVFIVNDEFIVEKTSVETGSILGESIVVYGIESGNIIKDARGIRDGQKVITE